MIEEAYCSYEISKLLKEKGFDESTQFVWYEHLPSQNAVHNSEIGKPKRDYFYLEEEGERNSPWTNNSPIPSYISGEVYSCPTHQMVCAWLREVYNIDIIIFHEKLPNDCYWARIERNLFTEIQQEPEYNSYEEAVESAIKYCLENLI